MTSLRILLAAILAAAAAGALAQTTNRPLDPIPPDKYGAPLSPLPQQQARPPAGTDDMLGSAPHSGVIAPPATGDRNVQTPPDTVDSAMPVIHPPTPSH